jgi:hypothetical protein
MKSLSHATDREDIVRRISAVTPSAKRLWGSMTVGGMVCHLSDSYRVALGELPANSVKLPLPAAAMKYMALQSPVRWPKGVRTVEEVRQGGGGTAPGDFGADRACLLDALQRFCEYPGLAQAAHPFFGPMSDADWLRWGYLHADHHLRQFSA